jgi:putative lipoic acid-binding regulatory protein
MKQSKSTAANGHGSNGSQAPAGESLLAFPCRFPVKAMGKAGGGFEAIATHIITSHAELWPGEPVRTNESKHGTYVALTAVIRATSQQQLDAIYQDLTDCPEVLMAL